MIHLEIWLVTSERKHWVCICFAVIILSCETSKPVSYNYAWQIYNLHKNLSFFLREMETLVDFLQFFQWETVFVTSLFLSCTLEFFSNGAYYKRNLICSNKLFAMGIIHKGRKKGCGEGGGDARGIEQTLASLHLSLQGNCRFQYPFVLFFFF